ncbi:biotin attachment protein [Halovenus sp. WSH3]|uniref:Biotin attachment protein n=1 Tax=Halovenus carboxidivorans TaxID=2692199 RepID=A0A6B0T1V7_9EURY|nr:lipoyl domain-containing protein [Halovenus carboxidivorans]MXR52044.1 biotin attachment protein [Halovenus carboxidivorans]
MSGDRVAINVDEYWPEDADDDEGVVINWFVGEGTTVDEGEVICEIQVEKVDVDIAAPAGGTVTEIVVPEDGEFERGETLAYIGEYD